MAELTVGIPVYNAQDYLKTCLKSLMRNVALPFDLLIVDDASAEDIESVLKIVLKRHPSKFLEKVTFIRNAKNFGFPHNANILLEENVNDFLCILNSDTYVPPRAFEKMINALNQNEKALIAGPSTNWTNSVQAIRKYKTFRKKSLDQIQKNAQEIAQKYIGQVQELAQKKNGNQIQGFCFMLKKETLNTIGHFDEIYGLGTYEESDYNSRSEFLGYKALWVKDAYVHHFGQRSWTLKHVWKILKNKNKQKWKTKTKSFTKGNIKDVLRVPREDVTKEISF